MRAERQSLIFLSQIFLSSLFVSLDGIQTVRQDRKIWDRKMMKRFSVLDLLGLISLIDVV